MYHIDVPASNENVTERLKNMEARATTQRIAWSLTEISASTGLSLGFLRNEVRRGTLPIKKFGRRVLVLEEDLRTYLTEGSPNKEDARDVA